MFKVRNQVHDCDTRSNEYLDIPKFRNCTGQITFNYRGTNVWNEIDKETKLLTNPRANGAKRRSGRKPGARVTNRA